MKTSPLLALDAEELDVLIRYHANRSLELQDGDDFDRHHKRAEQLTQIKHPEHFYGAQS
jgi:hypothetical protein